MLKTVNPNLPAGVATSGSSAAGRHPAVLYRAGMLLGLVIAAAATASITAPLSAAGRTEPELLNLLHGMVLIKASMAAAAVAFIFWRFGRPIEKSHAVCYTLAALLLVSAVVWLWSLASVPLASFFFYASLAGIVAVLRTDGTVFDGLQGSAGRFLSRQKRQPGRQCSRHRAGRGVRAVRTPSLSTES
jgi:hypothetical protein